MAASYSAITAHDDVRMHVGASYDNSNTSSTTYNNYYSRPHRSRPRSPSEIEEQRRRDLAFVKAVKEKQRPRAEYWYSQGIDIDFTDDKGYTALHHAAKVGLLVDYLLEKGFDINAESHSHGTPLCIAAAFGIHAVVQQLLAAHADLSIGGRYTPPPLHGAACSGRVGIVQLLVEAGAAVGAQGPSAIKGEALDLLQDEPDEFLTGTPLSFAAFHGCSDVVEYLLQEGADANAEAIWHHAATPAAEASSHPVIVTAAHHGTRAMVEALLKHRANSNARSSEGLTALMAASFGTNDSIVTTLLAAGARANERDEAGRTALHYAAYGSEAKIVKILLEAGADVRAHPEYLTTPLHIAAQEGSPEICTRILRQRDVDLHAVDETGHTPLQLACFSASPEVVKLLVERRSDLTAVDRTGFTPLHWAACRGSREVASILLRAGANLWAETTGGQTPRDMAKLEGKTEVAEYLEKKEVEARERKERRERAKGSGSQRSPAPPKVAPVVPAASRGASEPPPARTSPDSKTRSPERPSEEGTTAEANSDPAAEHSSPSRRSPQEQTYGVLNLAGPAPQQAKHQLPIGLLDTQNPLAHRSRFLPQQLEKEPPLRLPHERPSATVPRAKSSLLIPDFNPNKPGQRPDSVAGLDTAPAIQPTPDGSIEQLSKPLHRFGDSLTTPDEHDIFVDEARMKTLRQLNVEWARAEWARKAKAKAKEEAEGKGKEEAKPTTPTSLPAPSDGLTKAATLPATRDGRVNEGTRQWLDEVRNRHKVRLEAQGRENGKGGGEARRLPLIRTPLPMGTSPREQSTSVVEEEKAETRGTRVFSWAGVQKHRSKEDLYIVLHGEVINASPFVDVHPGGEEVLLEYGGRDATAAFEQAGHSTHARELLKGLKVGLVWGSEPMRA